MVNKLDVIRMIKNDGDAQLWQSIHSFNFRTHQHDSFQIQHTFQWFPYERHLELLPYRWTQSSYVVPSPSTRSGCGRWNRISSNQHQIFSGSKRSNSWSSASSLDYQPINDYAIGDNADIFNHRFIIAFTQCIDLLWFCSESLDNL